LRLVLHIVEADRAVEHESRRVIAAHAHVLVCGPARNRLLKGIVVVVGRQRWVVLAIVGPVVVPRLVDFVAVAGPRKDRGLVQVKLELLLALVAHLQCGSGGEVGRVLGQRNDETLALQQGEGT
jgi:hypothetical protein